MLRKRAIEHREAELRRLQQMGSPVTLGVVARMRVFHCDAGCRRISVRDEFELRVARARARAVERDAALVRAIEVAGPGALVCVRDRATVREPPRAGDRDRAVDAARTGRRRNDQATLPRVETVGNLGEHAMRRIRAGYARERLEFATRHVRHAAVGLAVAAERPQIRNALPCGLDRAPAQLGRLRCRRIVERGRRATQARESQARAQQVVVAAVDGRAYRFDYEIHCCLPRRRANLVALPAIYTGLGDVRKMRGRPLPARVLRWPQKS